MTVINTNASAAIASNAIALNDRAMTAAMERLSTGSRINSASDDAAGLAISSRMQSELLDLERAARNVNDGISLLQTADGAVSNIIDSLGRMKQLATQAASGTLNDSDRDALDLEFQQLMTEVDRIARNTEWNGQKILSGNGVSTYSATGKYTVSVQAGTGANQSLDFTLKNWVPEVAWISADETWIGGLFSSYNRNYTDRELLGNGDGIVDSAYGGAILAVDRDDNNGQTPDSATQPGGEAFISIKSAVSQGFTVNSGKQVAGAIINELDKAITAALSERAQYGAYVNRLTYAQDSLINTAQNIDASRSRIADADYAAETSELARTQIISQAATVMLAQANQSKQSVLTLLN